MLKKRYLFLILIICLFAISVVSAKDNATNDIICAEETTDEVVSIDENQDILTEKKAGTFTDLAIEIGNADSQLNLDRNYSYQYGDPEINLEKSIIINGNGYTLNGMNNPSKIFHIQTSDVVLNNINFINFNDCAIECMGPNSTLSGCSFVNCSSLEEWGYGGAVAWYGENGVVSDCNFVNCNAGYGSAINWNSNNGLMYDCSFENCTAWYGTVRWDHSAENGTLYGCDFKNCFSWYGGAIAWYAKDGIMFDSSFMNCSSWYGGAIYWEGCPSKIYDCNFVNCFADVSGGAIFRLFDNATLSDCSFMNCSSENGGALYLQGSNCLVSDCSFVKTSANRDGGAVAWYGDEGFIVRSIFKDCNATEHGGGIYWNGINGTLINPTFNNNYANVGPDWYSEHFLRIIYSTFLSASDVNTQYGVSKNLTATLIDYNNNTLDGEEINIILNNIKYTLETNSKGEASLAIPTDLTPKTYTATISFEGRGVYNASSTTAKVTVTKAATIITAPDVTKTYGGSEKLEITLTNQDFKAIPNSEIRVSLAGKNHTLTTDSKGKASLELNLNIGNYTANIFYAGNTEYGPTDTVTKITVNQLNITLSFAVNGNNVILTADASPSVLTGEVVFNVNGENYTAQIAGSKATYTLANLEAGSYVANAIYVVNATHESFRSNEVSFNISEDYFVITAPDIEKYYYGPERFVVTLTDSKGNPITNSSVSININGNDYTRVTDDKGVASMAINLNSGVYEVTTKYNTSEVKSTVTIKATVSGENITKMFRNDTQYYARFVDTNGNLLKNTDVEFNINGVFYTRKTNDQGVARMNINLNPGEYIITAKNPNSTEKYTNLIKVLPSIVEVHDLTKYYKNASKLTFKLLDDQGRPVGAGVSATININGVFYTRETNASGYVNMNINLPAGTYIATLSYNGLMASSTVKILPILSAKDIKMKYKDGTKFEAKLLDGQGKAFPNQKVTFNINGVFYPKTTDDNGIARLAINLPAGEYIITSMYENGATISNKVTISG